MYLGIDYGRKRVGLALGEVIPRGAGTLIIANKKDLLVAIGKICKENDVDGLVLGFPRRLDGKEGSLASEIREFGEDLKTFLHLPVYFEEEDLSSIEAEAYLKEAGKKYNRSKGKIDELAAILILERFLSRKEQESVKL